jgi:hypothetical protein
LPASPAGHPAFASQSVLSSLSISDDLGDGFLMRLGYAIVDAGWEGGLVPGNGGWSPALEHNNQTAFRSVR